MRTTPTLSPRNAVASLASRTFPGLTTPRVRGAHRDSTAAGDEWNSPESARALVIWFTEKPHLSRWLAGSLSVRLATRVIVPKTLNDPLGSFAAASAEWNADAGPLVIVGSGSGAAAALEVAAHSRVGSTSAGLPARRLALLYPVPHLGGAEAERSLLRGLPTTFLQSSSAGTHRDQHVALEKALRDSGIAVRDADYSNVDDHWATSPRAARGSARALNDLAAFIDRGVGTPSTFEVIPGWNLH